MSECPCQSRRSEDVERRLERLEHQVSSWLDYFRWPREAISNIEADVAFLRLQSSVTNNKLDDLKEVITQMAANFDELNADLQTLIAGYQSVVAENVILKQELANADADTQQAVADAVAASDVVNQAAVDAADAVIDAALAPVEEPPAEA